VREHEYALVDAIEDVGVRNRRCEARQQYAIGLFLAHQKAPLARTADHRVGAVPNNMVERPGRR